MLAGELQRAGGDVERALAAYSERLMPFMRAKQDAATGMAGALVPDTWFGLWFRRMVTHLIANGWIADLAIRGSVRDNIDLPAYGPA